jgi:hypothetical protein
MYDYCNNLLPISFKNIWLTNAEKRNLENEASERNLRDDNLFYVPYARLQQFFKFPLSDLPRTWNNFNNEVVANSRNSYKNLLKEHFLSKLSEIVICDRLLCPVCHLRAANL